MGLSFGTITLKGEGPAKQRLVQKFSEAWNNHLLDVGRVTQKELEYAYDVIHRRKQSASQVKEKRQDAHEERMLEAAQAKKQKQQDRQVAAEQRRMEKKERAVRRQKAKEKEILKRPYYASPQVAQQITRLRGEADYTNNFRLVALVLVLMGALLFLVTLVSAADYFHRRPFFILSYACLWFFGPTLLAAVVLYFSEAYNALTFDCEHCPALFNIEGRGRCTNCGHRMTELRNVLTGHILINRCPSCKERPIAIACPQCEHDTELHTEKYDRAPMGQVTQVGTLEDVSQLDKGLGTERKTTLVEAMRLLGIGFAASLAVRWITVLLPE